MHYDYIKNELSRNINNQFAVPNELIPELAEYKLVYWSVSHLYKSLKLDLDNKINSDYYIDRQDTLYAVTMINCSILHLYDLAINEPDYQIRISFRRARKHWNLPAYAIIKLPAPKGGLSQLRNSKGNYNHDKA